MDWYYALNDEQHGPITDAQLDDLIREGQVTGDTPVWHKKLSEWQPLSVARPAARAAASAMPALPTTSCAECGDIFPHTDMIAINGASVCATCKPKFLRRMKEGGPVPARLGMLWRKDNMLVLGKDTSFPDRCVCCNAPIEGDKLKRDLWWHPSPYFALAIIPFVYVIVALIIRKQATVYIGVCDAHLAARKRTIFIASLSAISGLVLLLLSAFIENALIALASLALLTGAGIYGALQASIITATKIDDHHVWVKGAGAAFLATLPEWNEPE